MDIKESLEKIRQTERNFEQTFDLVIILKNIDTQKSNISKEVVLPHGRGKEIGIGIISDDHDKATSSDGLDKMAKDKKKARKFVKNHEFFICSAPLMPKVGKILGKYMGPKGKMPKPIPPGTEPKPFVGRAKKSVRLRTASQPLIQCPVGTEKMGDKKIEENIKTVINELKKELPKGKAQIKKILLKSTMSPPVELSQIW